MTCLAMLTSCSLYQKPVSGASPMVRVLLYQGNSVTLKPSGNFIITYNSRKEAGDGTVSVDLSGNSLLLNGAGINTAAIDVYTGEGFVFGGKRYGGSASIIITNKSIFLINTIDIESYIKGVLPGEVSPSWDPGALKSQAVVSRTFALYEVVSSRKTGRIFDLFNDTRSQAYDGREKESRETSFAVDSTQGEVLRYEGRIIQAFYHSSSGGMTESSYEVFGVSLPYLTPVESPYSSVYKEDRWDLTIPLERAGTLLKITNRIESVIVTGRTASKRLKTVEIIDSAGLKTVFQGKDMRELLGPTLMKSTRANLKITNGSLNISGMGYGHGVGMGQWDALGMSKLGYSYKYILTYFYRGAEVEKIW
jgi:stage II sporulation protein D